MFDFSVGKNPVPYIACSRTSTGGRISVKPPSTNRETARRKIACSSRAESPTMYPKREPERRAARSISKRPSSRWSRGRSSFGGSPQRRISTASSSVWPSGTSGCGGFGSASSAASRAATAALSCSSVWRSSSLTCFSSSTCSGVRLLCVLRQLVEIGPNRPIRSGGPVGVAAGAALRGEQLLAGGRIALRQRRRRRLLRQRSADAVRGWEDDALRAAAYDQQRQSSGQDCDGDAHGA